MERIGVFGGSFNPCHKEHVNMAKAFIAEMGLDRLFIVPAYRPPHKSGAFLAPAKDRIAMLRLAFSGEQKISISEHEVKKGDVSYSYQTVEYFQTEYKNAEIFFLVGTDMLANFPQWKEPQRILNAATLVLVARGGEDTESAAIKYYEKFSKPFVKLNYEGKRLSSTMARAACALGVEPETYMPASVCEYAIKNRLYSDKYSDFVKKNLTTKRLEHTLGVTVLAQEYAKRVGEDVYKAYVAATLHDAAKYLSPADYGYTVPDGVPEPVVHQFLGAFIAESVLKIDDKDIINAIKYHTTGRAGMSTLEKIVFLADLLEEGRAYPEVDKLRAAVNEDFFAGFATCVAALYSFLTEGGNTGDVYYLTKECRDYYADKK